MSEPRLIAAAHDDATPPATASFDAAAHNATPPATAPDSVAMPRPTRRRLRTFGCLLLLLPFALWAVVRVFGLDTGYPFVQLIAFTPYVAIAAVLPITVAALARRWWIAGSALIVAVALAACVLPRMVAAPADARAADGVRVRLLSSNLRIGGADVEAIVALVREQRVDVLSLQEFTPDAQRALTAAGLDTLLPHQVTDPGPDANGSALYSRYPLRDDGSRRLADCPFKQARATVAVPGAAPVAVESVHPCAPYAADATPLWSHALSSQPAADPAGPARILIGDFNATIDHVALRRLVATGYRDAAAVLGDAATPTWPYYGAPARFTPKVTIDHVLADRRIGVVAYSVFRVDHTDHRPILAELTLPIG